ncbi:MAG: AI-2E family transporter [Steroidobacteraceae bacterium]
MSDLPSIPPENDEAPSGNADSNAHWLAVRVLAWIAAGCVLYVGKPALAPLLFAVLLALLLSPVVDALERHHVPRMFASILSVGILIGSLAIVVDTAWSPTLKWIEDAPAVLQKIEQKVRPIQRIIARINSVTTRASSLTSTQSGNAPPPAAAGDTLRVDALSLSRTILIDTMTVSILTIFLLAMGASTLRAIEGVFIKHGYHYQSMRILEAVRSELSRYFATLALINIGLGVVVTGVMALWGLPSPGLWGVMAAILNFMPYIGPTITLFVLTVVSLVTFSGYGPAIGVAGSFLAITTIEGQLVQPLLVGYRLNLNPIMLFVSIWLGGWFWGIAGIVLATPVLITLKEIANRQTAPSVLKAILNGPTATKVTIVKATAEDMGVPVPKEPLA